MPARGWHWTKKVPTPWHLFVYPLAPFCLFIASRTADQGRKLGNLFLSFSYSVGVRALRWWGVCVLATLLCCQIHCRQMVAQKLGRVLNLVVKLVVKWSHRNLDETQGLVALLTNGPECMCERGAWAWGGWSCLSYSAVRFTYTFFFSGPGWGLVDNKTNASERESRAVCRAWQIRRPKFRQMSCFSLSPVVEKLVYLQLNKKKAKAEGKKCHAKTMWSQ